MNQPNEYLMRMYNTRETLEKNGSNIGLQTAARLLYGSMLATKSVHDSHIAQAQVEQARLMNQQFSQLLASRGEMVNSPLRHTVMPLILHAGRYGDSDLSLMTGDQVPLGYYDNAMVRMASAIGTDLAQEWVKEAAIGIRPNIKPLSINRAILKPVGQAIGSGAKQMGQAIGAKAQQVGKAVGEGAEKLKIRAEGALDTMKNRMTGVDPSEKTQSLIKQREVKNLQAQANLNKMERMKSISPEVGGPPIKATPSQGVPRETPQIQPPTPAPRTPESTGVIQPTQTQPAQMMQPKVETTPTPQTGGAPGSEKPGTIDRLKDAFTGGNLKKTLLGLGAAYGGYKALSGGAKFLANTFKGESPPAIYNEGGTIPAYGVNQYGVADRSMPFTGY